jgi:hypothetical protein
MVREERAVGERNETDRIVMVVGRDRCVRPSGLTRDRRAETFPTRT